MTTIQDTPADCPFCVRGESLSSTILSESDTALLMKNTRSPGTFLIIPKQHIEDPAMLPNDWWQSLSEMLRHVPDLTGDYNVSLNIGPAAGQTVKHLHFWVVPREAGVPASGKGLALLVREANRQ